MHFSTAPQHSAAATPRRVRARNAVPELHTLALHGEMPSRELAETMMRFAAGDGAVLLTTNIIELRIDAPAALPADHVADDAARIALYSHIARGDSGPQRQRDVAPEEPLSVVAELLEMPRFWKW